MALFQLEISKANRQAYTPINYRTLLLNTDKMNNFYQDTDGGTVFFYDNNEDRKNDAIEYKTTASKYEVNQRLLESGGAPFLNLTVVSIDGVTWNKKFRINTNKIILGEDIDATSCYLDVAIGSFKIKRFVVASTISEIDAAESQSTSLSAS